MVSEEGLACKYMALNAVAKHKVLPGGKVATWVAGYSHLGVLFSFWAILCILSGQRERVTALLRVLALHSQRHALEMRFKSLIPVHFLVIILSPVRELLHSQTHSLFLGQVLLCLLGQSHLASIRVLKYLSPSL